MGMIRNAYRILVWKHLENGHLEGREKVNDRETVCEKGKSIDSVLTILVVLLPEKGKGKVITVLLLTEHHAMEAYRGIEV
jgi:hypothetical protein